MMTYSESKTAKQAAGQALETAKKGFQTAKEDLQSAKADTDIAYENLTQTMAENEAGDATQTDVDNAKTAHQEAQQGVNDARVTVDAKAKAIQVFTRKLKQAKKQFKRAARLHYMDEGKEIGDEMVQALQNLQAANKKIQAFYDELKGDGLNPGMFTAPPFSEIILPVRDRANARYNLKTWKNQLDKIPQKQEKYFAKMKARGEV